MNLLVRLITAIRDAHRRWYGDEMRRQRRVVEEDARRLGGTVTWSDTPWSKARREQMEAERK